VPTNLAAVAVSSAQINLSWTASTDNVGVAGYKLYRNGGGTPLATPVGTAYSDMGLTASTTYSYTVSACDAAGNCSAKSAAVSTTTLTIAPPNVPAGLAAVAVSSNQINLSWTASAGAASYAIYLASGITPLATVSGTTYDDTGLTSSTAYGYEVSACGASGSCSAKSAAVSTTTSPSPTLCTPAPFPSVLKTSGRTLVDSNGCTQSLMKGFSLQTGSNYWPTSTMNAIAAKGANFARLVLFWDQLQSTDCSALSATTGDGAAYVSEIDAQLAADQAAGIYTELEIHLNVGRVPACASTNLTGAAATDETNEYMQNGQWITQYLANRYGNPSSPEYTKDALGFGINEPPEDATATSTNVNTVMEQDQSTMLTWIRGTNGAGGYAPQWIGFVAETWANWTPIYNANPGQTNQCGNCANANPTAYNAVGGNVILDFHDYIIGCNSVWETDYPSLPASSCDGRAYSGGPYNDSNGGYLVGPGGSYPMAGESEATAQAQMANYLYPYILFSKEANIPLMIGEFGWVPAVNITGVTNYANDLMQLLASASPVIEAEWDYNVTQSQDGWAANPGSGATGANPDGWQTFTDDWLEYAQ
jgi:chitodextrinase